AAAAETIRVSAVVLARPDRRVLTVRKAGTTMFMFPGGKHLPGEDPLDTAVREVAEETGLRLRPDELTR
ncbi:NUDIX domain-containing protein, partial [Micrococcus endophyticus]